MRPKKDPDIRRDQFIDAATELFLQSGYDGVSIKSVLDAVGDRSISPSVFYYYFSNKDDLYHAVVESIAISYVDGFKSIFLDDALELEELVSRLAWMMHETIKADSTILSAATVDSNRSFVLDVKERVTASLSELWEHLLPRFGISEGQDSRNMALFISGGISAMLMAYMCKEIRDEDTEHQLVRDIIVFSASVLGVKDSEKELLLRNIR